MTHVFQPHAGSFGNPFNMGLPPMRSFSQAGIQDPIAAQVFGPRSTWSDVSKYLLGDLAVGGAITLSKDVGTGIKVDVASPTFPWHDMLGPISVRGIGGKDPAYAVYQGGIRGHQFGVGEEVFIEFHMPHDYYPGSDLFIHSHWSHNATTVTGGSVTWGYEVTYAKGYDQAAFIAPVTRTVQQNASTTQYKHMIAETQISAATPAASQIDTDNLEVDGLILVRCYLSANAMTVSGGGVPEPFLHMVDLHYQSTSLGTKQKNGPAFYT